MHELLWYCSLAGCSCTVFLDKLSVKPAQLRLPQTFDLLKPLQTSRMEGFKPFGVPWDQWLRQGKHHCLKNAYFGLKRRFSAFPAFSSIPGPACMLDMPECF